MSAKRATLPVITYLEPSQPWMGALIADRLPDCGSVYKVQLLPIFNGCDVNGNLQLCSFSYTLLSATHISARDFSVATLLIEQARELAKKLTETYTKHMQTIAKIDILAEADKHLKAIMLAVESDQVQWKSAPPPKEGASRAFSGVAPGYQIMVVQANTPEYGIVHEGMVMASGSSFAVIRLPPELADKVYHIAAANQN